MSDRLKFRVWDKRLSKWMDALKPCWTVYDEVRDQADHPENERDEEYVVEQCTGLRDSNGTLIYEGDIVEYGYPCSCFAVDFFEIRDEDVDSLTVIGNIHQNPELLEADDDRATE